MKFIPTICADPENVLCIPNNIPLNYYLQGNVSGSDNEYGKSEIDRSLKDIKNNNYEVAMIHLLVPNDVSLTYKYNKPYFDFINSMGRVGLTLHYKTPRRREEENELFQQVIDMHLDLPKAVWYIENEREDLYSVLRFVQGLRSIDIESYMLIDTCHLQADLYRKLYYSNCIYNHSMVDIISKFSKYIGAYHLSASQKFEGFIFETHGKPIITKDDEEYFVKLVYDLCRLNYENDLILIPEVTEEDYSLEGGRKNGKKAYELMLSAGVFCK